MAINLLDVSPYLAVILFAYARARIMQGVWKGDNQPAERFGGALGEQRPPRVEADNAQHPTEITQRHQAPFAAHLVEPAHQEVAVSGAAFERAKRVFGQRLAAAHHVLAGDPHAGPVSLDHVLIRPAFDLAPLALASKAAPAQRTHPANRATTGIADRHLAAGLTLLAAHRPQRRAGRTAIDIGPGVVAEVLEAEPALRFQSLAAIGWRNIGQIGRA